MKIFVAYLVVLYLVSLGLAYYLRFTEATRHIGRALSDSGSPTGFQVAITPPGSVYAGFALYALCIAAVVLGFLRYGLLKGIATFFGFVVLVILNTTLLLPEPESPYFRDIVLKSMVRRHANYLRDGDQLRAAAIAYLLQRAGIPLGEFLQAIKSQGARRGDDRTINKQDVDRK